MKNSPKVNLVGLIIGRLTVKNYIGGPKKAWECLCECGKTSDVRGANLRIGKTNSCGCLKKEKMAIGLGIKHGMYKSRTYKSWDSMLERCLNPRNKCYESYAGRGILVCGRWRVFDNFLADMGERPEGMSLDRIDNNGNYEPGNCRWATAKTQSSNTRANRFYNFNGAQMTARQISDATGIEYAKLRERLKRGWEVARATSP